MALVSWEEFEAFLDELPVFVGPEMPYEITSARRVEAACHECTSERGYQSKTIFGGGPCCDALGHKITPVYQD